MKRNTHVIVPAPAFRLAAGADALAEYQVCWLLCKRVFLSKIPPTTSPLQFNTRTARHLFCRVCGVCPFYRPRSNPGAYAVTLRCIDPAALGDYEVRAIDGRNWEAAVPASGICGLG